MKLLIDPKNNTPEYKALIVMLYRLRRNTSYWEKHGGFSNRKAKEDAEKKADEFLESVIVKD